MDQIKMGEFIAEETKTTHKDIWQIFFKSVIKQFQSGNVELPIVKDTTPNMTNPRLYITSNHENILNNLEKASKINDVMNLMDVYYGYILMF